MAWSLLDQDEPEVLLLILVAGATPVMRPLQDQRWETFSGNWQTDVTIAFTWLCAVFHTSSCYARGIDMTPRGRDEDGPEGP